MFPKLKTINERFIKAAVDQRLINTASDGARPMDKAQLKLGTTFRTCSGADPGGGPRGPGPPPDPRF